MHSATLPSRRWPSENGSSSREGVSESSEKCWGTSVTGDKAKQQAAVTREADVGRFYLTGEFMEKIRAEGGLVLGFGLRRGFASACSERRQVEHGGLVTTRAKPVAKREARTSGPRLAFGDRHTAKVREVVAQRDGAAGDDMIGEDHLVHLLKGVHTDQRRLVT